MEYLSGSDNQYYSGQGFKNPAFSIKIVKPNDSLQQKRSFGRENPSDDPLDNVKVGTVVSFKDDNDVLIKGRISRISRNEEGINTYAFVKDRKGNLHKIEATALIFDDTPDPSEDKRKASTPGVFNTDQGQGVRENHFLDFDSFCKL